MNDYQVSTELSLDSSFLVDTLLAEEKKPEVEPSEHIEWFRNLALNRYTQLRD
jgi:hypothetical protein